MVDFDSTINRMNDFGFKPNPDLVYIRIPNAEEEIKRGLKYFIGDNAAWIDKYNEIVEWCEDNHGRGLLVMGNCGTGKTLICGKILPILINHYLRRVVYIADAKRLNKDIDIVLTQHQIYIDDIGIEDMSVNYGEKRLPLLKLWMKLKKKVSYLL